MEKNFISKEIYNDTEAATEAKRCLFCYDAECIKGCPTSINIPFFINQISNNDILGSAKTILSSNILGYSCSKVCPVEVLCVKKCILQNNPIKIHKLQEYAVLNALKKKNFSFFLNYNFKKRNKKIAIIGSGPSSISAAAMLSFSGFTVDIYEKENYVGGLNSLGIIPSKLNYNESMFEINSLFNFNPNINIYYNCNKNKNFNYENVNKKYDEIILCIGLGEDKNFKINNKDIRFSNIIGAIELIKKIKLNLLDINTFKYFKNIHVLGGGNSAIDVAILLKTISNSDVSIFYRKNKQKMPAYESEILKAYSHSINIFYEQEPKEIFSLNNQTFITYKNDFGKEKTLEFDFLVYSFGQNRENLNILNSFSNINLNSFSLIDVDENYKTGNSKIWASGDCVNGGKDVVSCVEISKHIVLKILENN